MVQSVCLSVSTLFLFCRPLYIALYCTLFPQFGFYSCCSTSLVLMKTSRWNFPEEWWNFLKVHLVNFILWKLEALLVFFSFNLKHEVMQHPLPAFRQSSIPLFVCSAQPDYSHRSPLLSYLFLPFSHSFSFLTRRFLFQQSRLLPSLFIPVSLRGFPIWFSSPTHHCAKGQQG